MNKKIVIINGTGGVGKDTFIQQCQEFVEIKNISSVDKVKEAAKILVNWNGEKDEKTRKFLADLKKLSIDYNDAPIQYIKSQADEFNENNTQQIMFIHIREISEIEKVKRLLNAKTLLVTNNRVEDILSNESDANVKKYNYDYYIENNGTIEELKELAKKFVQE